MTNRYGSFFTAFKASQSAGNTLSKEEMVEAFTGGATTSLKELSDTQLTELVQTINQTLRSQNNKDDKMRKSVIAIFKKMEKSTEAAIAWAEKQGVKGVKKKFNDYTTQELFVLIRVAELILVDYNKALRRSMGRMK